MLQQYVYRSFYMQWPNWGKKPNANVTADDMLLPILVADDNCICYLLVRCAANKSSSHPKGVFKGLVKGEAIRFLRSNSSQDNYQRTISTSGYPNILLTHSSLQFHTPLGTTTSNLSLLLTHQRWNRSMMGGAGVRGCEAANYPRVTSMHEGQALGKLKSP